MSLDLFSFRCIQLRDGNSLAEWDDLRQASFDGKLLYPCAHARSGGC
ncbi:hypothetical protein [Streptomyces sp. NPDC005167]